MFDIGWSELLLIGIVALIVVGPRDLPALFRALGRLTAKARGMAREFSSAMEDAARDSGLDDAAKSLRDVKDMTSKKSLGIDRLERAVDKFEKWDPKIPSPREGLKKDPAEPGSPKPSAAKGSYGKPADPASFAPGAAPAAPATAEPTTPAPGAAAAPAATPDPAPHSAPQPGQRRLHAVRRRASKDS
ncbi:MAG: Sec-independent protein translocase protein TatB [Paracoccus sp. (in: a-proteobacteria)]|nr:Sec-independent protein translocase protein TatB [Paracoccus sp. (in: a-proteobacteria)]